MANRKPLNVSQARRDEIKANYDSLKKSDLSGDERRYFVLIENGKRSARKNIRFDGRYLGGEIVPIIRKVAERKEMSVKAYLDKHHDEVLNLMNKGYTQQLEGRSIDATIETIDSQRRKTVEVEDGDGIVTMQKAEAIERLAMLQQFASSNTTIVAIGIPFKLYKNNKIQIVCPAPETYEGFDAEAFEELLDMLGIFYIKSPDKGKK